MTVTSPENLEVKLLHVKRLHKLYHGTPQLCRAKRLRKEREMGIFSRPTMGDRMDNAQEKRFRRQQTERELAMEQAERKLEDQRIRVARAKADLARKYKGK